MKFNGININIGLNVKLGKNVQIGDNTTIYDNVTIGDNTIISSNCLIGEPVSNYYKDTYYHNPELVIGNDSIIRSNTIIYAGTVIGSNLNTGHFAIIRENNVLGHHCSVGVYTHLMDRCKIGNYVRFHSYDSIGELSEIGDFVQFYPCVTTTNSPVPPSDILLGCKFGEFSIIASNAIFLPGSELGRHCFVGSQSSVKGKYEDFSFIAGNPAKRLMDLRKAPIINPETKKRQYPWPYNFTRNMPWEHIGFDEWLRINNKEL